MSQITLEQALLIRLDRFAPRLAARSPGFGADWQSEAEAIIHDFGERPAPTFRCPEATVFAKPLTDKHIAVVRVRDEGETYPSGLRFHFLVVDKKIYEGWIRDPFMLAAKVEPAWDATELPSIALP